MQKIKKYLYSKHVSFDEFRWLLRLISPYRGKLFCLILLRCFLIVIGVGSAVVNKYMVDLATAYLDVTGIIILMVVCSGINLLGSMLLSVLAIRFTERLSIHIRTSMYSHILNSVWIERSQQHSEGLLTRLTSDVSQVSDGVVNVSTGLTATVFQFVLAFVLLYIFDASIALFALLSVPFIAFVSLVMGIKLKRIHMQLQQAEADYRIYLQEQISHADVVKAFQYEEESQAALAQLQKRRMELVIKKSRYNIGMRFGVNCAFMSAYLFAFITGALKVASNTISYGTMTAFLSLVNQVQSPVLSLSRIFSQVIAVFASAARIREIADMTQEDFEEKLSCSSEVGILANQIAFAYNEDNIILKDLSFELPPKSITAIMGHSGAGKTTLVRLLLGFLQPTEGSIVYTDGSERYSCSERTRSLISYVPQGNTLFSGTIAENLRLGCPDATDSQMMEALHMACADVFVMALPDGLQTCIGEKGHGLSEGQAQRIAIARAFLRPSPILILDEATSALDEQTELQILMQIKKQYLEKTCLVISHRSAITEFADQIINLC
ncbi:MAG: ABC transporter ATP-binding protein [Coprococcus sp.]